MGTVALAPSHSGLLRCRRRVRKPLLTTADLQRNVTSPPGAQAAFQAPSIQAHTTEPSRVDCRAWPAFRRLAKPAPRAQRSQRQASLTWCGRDVAMALAFGAGSVVTSGHAGPKSAEAEMLNYAKPHESRLQLASAAVVRQCFGLQVRIALLLARMETKAVCRRVQLVAPKPLTTFNMTRRWQAPADDQKRDMLSIALSVCDGVGPTVRCSCRTGAARP
jgi:hypothetical protein